jgi:hypothetical protein
VNDWSFLINCRVHLRSRRPSGGSNNILGRHSLRISRSWNLRRLNFRKAEIRTSSQLALQVLQLKL